LNQNIRISSINKASQLQIGGSFTKNRLYSLFDKNKASLNPTSANYSNNELNQFSDESPNKYDVIAYNLL
jgi:hypothetical protein